MICQKTVTCQLLLETKNFKERQKKFRAISYEVLMCVNLYLQNHNFELCSATNKQFKIAISDLRKKNLLTLIFSQGFPFLHFSYPSQRMSCLKIWMNTVLITECPQSSVQCPQCQKIKENITFPLILHSLFRRDSQQIFAQHFIKIGGETFEFHC